MTSNNREFRATKDIELDRIIVITPETKLENPDQKMYRINRKKNTLDGKKHKWRNISFNNERN